MEKKKSGFGLVTVSFVETRCQDKLVKLRVQGIGLGHTAAGITVTPDSHTHGS